MSVSLKTRAFAGRYRRFHSLKWCQYLIILGLVLFFVSSWEGAGFGTLTTEKLLNMPGQMAYVISNMFPPSLERIGPVFYSLVQTIEMAIMGNLIGLPIAALLALLAARNISPHWLVYYVTRSFITLLRTIPSLVYGILMIAAVGLGPRAGVFTLALASIGFCGRFFAEAIEEVDAKPLEAMRLIGSNQGDIFFSVIIPEAMPSFINTMLFNLEQTVRASTVLGIVGAGGIGIELLVSFQTFRYSEASTILILVFLMVILIEQFCAYIRKKIL